MKTFVFILVSLLALDFIWLKFIAASFYVGQFGELGRIEGGEFKVIYWAALAVYIFMSVGLAIYVLPLLADANLGKAFIYGALFGLILYGVYDMTNHATLKSWPLLLCAVDMAWGSVLCGIVTLLTQWCRSKGILS